MRFVENQQYEIRVGKQICLHNLHRDRCAFAVAIAIGYYLLMTARQWGLLFRPIWRVSPRRVRTFDCKITRFRCLLYYFVVSGKLALESTNYGNRQRREIQRHGDDKFGVPAHCALF